MSRGGAALFVAIVLGAVGCENILGFQDPVGVQCILASDCGSGPQHQCIEGVCTVECRGDNDCATYGSGHDVCQANVCGPPATLDAAGGALPEASADAASMVPEAAATADVAVTPDVAEAGSCVPACPEFGYCDGGSTCLDFDRYGFPSPTGPAEQLGENGYLHAIQIDEGVCGYLTGMGFVVGMIPIHQNYRFGLYHDDGGGHPGTLIAQTGPGTVHLGPNEAPVTSAIPIGCGDTAEYYWIAGTWDQDIVEFVSEATPVSNWVIFPADAGVNYISDGLPTTFPTEDISEPMYRQPHVYIMVANQP
jgi:hypothetical protein